jgi:protein tyrosine phosphatase (PTP) superfamily phosphohydrolase (DUF442 family)
MCMVFAFVGPAGAQEPSCQVLSASHTIELITKEGLSKFYHLGKRFYSGSRPKGEVSFRSLKEQGITTLISVEDATPDFETAKKMGMTYLHLPLDRNGVRPKQAQAVAAAVESNTKPVYIHCTTGTNRGPAAIAIMLRKEEGWSEKEAIDWMELAKTSHQNEGLYQAVREIENLFLKPVPPEERLVGMAYTTWHHQIPWHDVWGEPELGYYRSDDRAVIRQHAEWLADAGVDFIWIDWSNNVNYTPGEGPNPVFDMIEGSVKVLFEEYAQLAKHPKISIFLGVTGAPEAATDGRLQKKADQVYRDYVSNPVYRPLLQDYLGKPLLVVYVNTPSPWQEGVPKWDDDRFTVRWMTGYVTEQTALRTPSLVSKYGYWSWEDRGPQTYTTHGGHPEAMVVTASWRRQSEPGQPGYIPEAPRNGGETFRQQWARACEIGPRFAMVVSWNEWVLGEQPSPEVSKDIEPSKTHGHFYLDLLKKEIAHFKGRP